MEHDANVRGAMFNQNESRILTWSHELTIDSGATARLWDVTGCVAIGQPMKHDSSVYGAVFNKDETRILTWSKDGTARLWDATDGASIGQPMKHDYSVYGAVFNHDYTRILTWSRDYESGAKGTARLWDATDGASIGLPMKHDRYVNGALFNKDETRILTWGGDGKARLWNISVDNDFPQEYLPLTVEVATGTTMDDYGNVTASSKRKWEEQRAEYIRIAEEHLKHCKYKSANIYSNYQKPYWGKK
jgi:WD40 repeat protein